MEKLLKKHIGGLRETGHGYNGYCPFPEHNPKNSRSFHINFEKNYCKCFSCGRGMPVFEFLLYCGMEVANALPYLSEYKFERKEATHIVEYQLGKSIPKSFIDRGFTIETLKHFDVGYNKYENHTTIPIYFSNTLVGVFYRTFPKFMRYNEGFQKSSYLYNFENTENRIIVEGFTDTFRTWQNGFKNVSAILGSQADGRQIELLSSYKELYLALDFDMAGIAGMYKCYNDLRYNDTEIYILMYKADLCDKNDMGNCSKNAMEKAYANKLPFTLFDIYMQSNFPEQRTEILNKLKIKL